MLAVAWQAAHLAPAADFKTIIKLGLQQHNVAWTSRLAIVGTFGNVYLKEYL